MRMLKDVKISEKELKKLQEISRSGGSEGCVLFFKNHGNKSYFVRKIFHKNFEYCQKNREKNERICENKRLKITRLYHLKIFQNDVRVLRTISCQGKFVGYDMKCYPTARTFYQIHFRNMDEVLFYTKQIQKLLEEFHEHDIVYGDISAANILIDPKRNRASFCDLDNMQVEHYPIDLYNYQLQPFCKKGLIPSTTDAYMFNLFLLSSITGMDADRLLDKLRHNWKPQEIQQSGMGILQQMATAAKSHHYDGTYITPYVKRK